MICFVEPDPYIICQTRMYKGLEWLRDSLSKDGWSVGLLHLDCWGYFSRDCGTKRVVLAGLAAAGRDLHVLMHFLGATRTDELNFHLFDCSRFAASAVGVHLLVIRVLQHCSS